MVFLYLTAGYLLISAILYAVFSRLFSNGKTALFAMPKSAFLFYLLSFTWGLPMTLAGCVGALFLLLFRKKPERFGRAICFSLPGIRFGVSLGIVLIVPKNCSRSVRMHEHGHSQQNAFLGIFMPVVVALPSFLRFWARRLSSRKTGQEPKRPYDEIWFEKSATLSGVSAFSG